MRERWQPQRLGLIDIFYYDQEEFPFRDGRLLLRGSNGTGKSKVLALTLPFLLDGDLSAHRVEPDADPKKRMDWNLLLGGEHPNDERLGYAWLEFARPGEICTIGCGLKAVKGRGIASSWFFITNQRIGDELSLVDATGVALTEERLREAIGTRGAVHRTARDHRRAVDERLFGLGDRYGALIDLLIKIRAPQLSKRPDEKGLSQALTDALPPLDGALITDVAEAFRALEDDGEQLAAMVEARDAAERYLKTYRAYARMAARRRAAPVRQEQTAFDRVSRELAETEERLAAAQAALEHERQTRANLRTDRVRLDARRQAMRDDPDARELRAATEAAGAADERHDEARDAAARADDRVAELGRRLAGAEDEATEAAAAVATVHKRAAAHAGEARITVPLGEHGASVRPDDGDRADPGGAAPRSGSASTAAHREDTDASVARHQSAIDRVNELLRRWEIARDELARARVTTEQAAGEHALATAQRDAALSDLREAGANYARAVRTHLEAARELALPDPAAAFAQLDAWLQTVDGANPVQVAADGAARDAARRIASAQAQASAEADETRAALNALEQEITELEAGAHPIPPPSHTRSRTGRPGAPFWQLVDFRDDVAAPDRPGLEAALEAAGILDAWVTPTGELLDPDTDDAFLDAASGPVDGPRLADVLVGNDVHRLLTAIGLGESSAPVWVTASGRFRNGVLRGAWHKPAAEYVGHAAREAARQVRLVELGARAEAAGIALIAVQDRIADLDRRHQQLEEEMAGVPPDSAVRDADSAVVAAESGLAAAERRLEDARTREHTAHDAEQDAAATLRADAADLGLPATAEELAAVAAALTRLRETLAELWPALSRQGRAAAERRRGAADADGARADRGAAAARLTQTERQLSAAAERRDTLKATVGAAVAEVERQLAEVEHALKVNAADDDACDARLGAAQRAEGSADGRRGELTQGLDAATEARATAVEGLERFATTGLIAVAMPEVQPPEEWNLTQALRLAREIEAALADDPDDDARWQRLHRQVGDELGELADALRRHGNNAAASYREEGVVVEVTFRGRTTSLPELAEGLASEVVERRRLLDAREREILENHLVGEVASTLQELVSAAEQRVADTNRELAERPTSTGMQLRLRWTVHPDGPEGLAGARARLLRQTADAWSEDDRAAVGGFLQNQIKAARAEDPTGSWLDHLTGALDYRAWHRFIVERRQGGVWRSATGPSSGGERVLAASIPLFAAASSYYSSAGNPHAPRLVMLDEAFAGVDDRARAQCLGLLASFDLDVVMTSEREWGCYAEVPGLAIAQLSRIDGVAAVLVTHWTWDGVQRTGPPLWDASTASA